MISASSSPPRRSSESATRTTTGGEERVFFSPLTLSRVPLTTATKKSSITFTRQNGVSGGRGDTEGAAAEPRQRGAFPSRCFTPNRSSHGPAGLVCVLTPRVASRVDLRRSPHTRNPGRVRALGAAVCYPSSSRNTTSLDEKGTEKKYKLLSNVKHNHR